MDNCPCMDNCPYGQLSMMDNLLSMHGQLSMSCYGQLSILWTIVHSPCPTEILDPNGLWSAVRLRLAAFQTPGRTQDGWESQPETGPEDDREGLRIANSIEIYKGLGDHQLIKCLVFLMIVNVIFYPLSFFDRHHHHHHGGTRTWTTSTRTPRRLRGRDGVVPHPPPPPPVQWRLPPPAPVQWRPLLLLLFSGAPILLLLFCGGLPDEKGLRGGCAE